MSIFYSQHTPPESFTDCPLTPPPTGEKKASVVATLVRAIKSLKAGKPPAQSAYTIDLEAYTHLLHCLETDPDRSLWGFVEDKLHYDYSPSISQLVLRMPTTIHEKFIACVRDELSFQLGTIARGHGGLSADFAKDVTTEDSSTINFKNEFGRHDPDSQFSHARANYPGVILEVAYSQNSKDLQRLAKEYILGSKGQIRVIIGFNLGYRDQKGTVSVWESRIVWNRQRKKVLDYVQTVRDEPFQHATGKPNKSASIKLQLSHFAITAFTQKFGPLRDPIFISAERLSQFLQTAIKRSEIRDSHSGVEPLPDEVPDLLRELTPSSEEELEEDREKRFKDDVERAEKKELADDASYKEASLSSESANS